MLIVFLISLFGHSFTHRLLLSLAREFAFSQRLLTMLLVFNLLVIASITLLSRSVVSLWLFIGILVITLKFFPNILRIFLERRLRRSLIPFLDVLILGLQTGKSFRQSLQLAIENQSGWVRHQFLEVYQAMVFSERDVVVKSALLKDFMGSMVFIDGSKNRCLEQAKALRREIKTLEDFRRRSGQVTQQIKMQAIIVTALFLALLIFVIMQFGFLEHRKLILMSVGIFIFGLAWIFSVGRRMKWKV